MRKLLIAIALIITASTIHAEECEECQPSEECCDEYPAMFHGNVLSVGPEYYYVKRTRKGGTKQNGSCVGVRANYDYIKRYNFYIGAQGFWGTGTLDGHTGSRAKLRSRLTDWQVEGSIGYTFQAKCWRKPWITPIVGYGYFHEENNFTKPSPLPIKYTTKFSYIPFGFLSGIMLTSALSVGLNVRIRYPWDPQCHISDDPDFEDRKQLINHELSYRVEVPFVYKTQFFCNSLLVGLMPFFDDRHYGGRENYPFDFLETHLKSYGFNIQLMYQF